MYADYAEVRGVLYDVHKSLGPGFREETYKHAVLIALRHQNIPAKCEVEVPVVFKGEKIDTYRLDLVIDDKVILELKAVEELHSRYEAQLVSYLHASGLKLGLLVNFGNPELFIKRYVNEHHSH